MTEPNRQSAATRNKILDAACGLFAEKGYRGTTVATICRTAAVNIAAINYHFGGKESLYQQAWRHAHDRLMTQVPPDGGVAPGEPAAARLRGRIRAGLQRAMMGDAVEIGIMRNEMANPTGLLRQVIDDAIGPIRQATQEILRELLGPRSTPARVEWCEVCVVAPWMHVMHHRQAEKHAGLAPVFREGMLDEVADHFTEFAMAGIRAIRRRIEAPGGRSRRKARS